MAIYNIPANKAAASKLYLKEPISPDNLDLDNLDLNNPDLNNSGGKGSSTPNTTP